MFFVKNNTDRNILLISSRLQFILFVSNYVTISKDYHTVLVNKFNKKKAQSYFIFYIYTFIVGQV